MTAGAGGGAINDPTKANSFGMPIAAPANMMVNPFGNIYTNPYDAPTQEAGKKLALHPDTAFYNAFVNAGNPWNVSDPFVSWANNYLQPGLSTLYQLTQNVGNLDNFSAWAGDLMRSGNTNAPTDGSMTGAQWLGSSGYNDVLNKVLTGNGIDPLVWNSLFGMGPDGQSGTQPDQAANNVAQTLVSAAEMAFSPEIAQSIAYTLKGLEDQWHSIVYGSGDGRTAIPFATWLAQNGYMNTLGFGG